MSNLWQDTSIVPPYSWGNSDSKYWDTIPHLSEWDPKTCVPGRPLRTKRHTTTLVETLPTKILTIAEV